MAAAMSLQASEPQKTTVNVSNTQMEKNAEIKFETLNHDFGTFSVNDPVVKCVFKFTKLKRSFSF